MEITNSLTYIFVLVGLQAEALAERQCSFSSAVNLSSVHSAPLEGSNARLCSIRNRYFYDYTADFHLHTAAECFYYTNAKHLKQRPCLAVPFVCLNGDARSFSEGDCHMPKTEVQTSALFQAVQNIPGAGFRWVSCAKHAIECCQKTQNQLHATPEGHCPGTWDGLTCFEDAPADTLVKMTCPLYLYSSVPKCSHVSTRKCRSDSTWFKKNSTFNEEYTNYNGCTPQERNEEIAGVYYFAITLFTLSVFFCLPAIVIFSCSRALHCQRISMHKNLVTSVMLSSLMQLIDHSLLTLPEVTQRSTLAEHSNVWWCKLLQVLQKYFWFSQYTWMLCEGFYLYILVSEAFVSYSTLAKYYVFGWGVPAVFVLIYAVCTAALADADCWRSITIYDYIVTCPATLCLLLNVVFMVRVIFIIIGKLKGPDNLDNLRENNLRRIFRACLILTPLFGVHYVVSIFASGAACANKLLISYISWFCVSSQGMFVSVVLCYSNGEVQFQLKKAYYRLTDKRQFELVMQKPSADARMSMVTVHSDASSGLLHRSSVV